MDEQKKVRVTMNQDSQDNKKHDLEYYLTPKNQKSRSSFLAFNSRSTMGKMVKPILLAILLGGLFGAGLIYYFSDLTPDALPVTTTENNEEEEGKTGDSNEELTQDEQTFSKSGQVYEVIQFGLFSKKENADELIQNNLQSNSVPATVQEQNGQYFVISHLISSEDEKNSVTDWLESKDLVYMEHFFYKSWSFDAIDLNVSEDVLTWLNEGLSIIEKGENADESWQSEIETWLNSRPDQYEQSEKLNQINELLGNLSYDSNETQNDIIQKTILLNLHLFYTELA